MNSICKVGIGYFLRLIWHRISIPYITYIEINKKELDKISSSIHDIK